MKNISNICLTSIQFFVNLLTKKYRISPSHLPGDLARSIPVLGLKAAQHHINISGNKLKVYIDFVRGMPVPLSISELCFVTKILENLNKNDGL